MTQAVHPLRRPPLLDLRRLPRGGHRHRRHPPRAGRGVRRRGLGEGHARARASCALTAGPGVTNGMSAMGSALQNGSPMRRARRPRAGDALGPGLAAGDRPRAVRRAADALGAHGRLDGRDPGADGRGARAPRSGRRRARRSSTSRSTRCSWSPTSTPTSPARCPTRCERRRPPTASSRPIELLRGAERPVIMAGTGLYWAHGEHALQALCEELQIPVFLNGLARGCVPADHRLFFSRARGTALKGADVALVIGVPMDFRLGFGGSFGEDTQIVAIGSVAARARRTRARSRPSCTAAWRRRSTRCATGRRRVADRSGWVAPLRAVEDEKRAGEQAELDRRRARRCTRCASTRELDAGARPRRDRDRRRRRLRLLRRQDDRHLRAGLLDGPGPVRLPRLRARATRSPRSSRIPDRQVCLLLGDGAFGFSGHGVRHASCATACPSSR